MRQALQMKRSVTECNGHLGFKMPSFTEAEDCRVVQEAAGSSRESSSSIPAQLHEYVQQMKDQQDACITPSGMDQPLRCGSFYS